MQDDLNLSVRNNFKNEKGKLYMIFIAFFTALIIYASKYGFEKNKKISLVLIITLILITGLRKSGYDLDNYRIHYNEMNNITDIFLTIYEFGFSFIAYIFNKFNIGFHSFMLFIAFLSISLKTRTFNKLSPYPIISFLLYYIIFFIYNDFTQIRHGLAIGICFYSILFMKDIKFKLLSFILLASHIHYSNIRIVS